MLTLGLLLVIGAVGVMAWGFGLVAAPDRMTRRRAQAALAAEVGGATPRWAQGSERSGLQRLTPVTMVPWLQRQLVLAGSPADWPLAKVLAYKPLAAAAMSLLALLWWSSGFDALRLIGGVLVIVLGYFLPDLLIYNRAIKRQQIIQEELPDLMDQIVISVEAGIGFEAALRRSIERRRGPLADEIGRLLQDITLGLSRREAYLAFADRTSLAEVRTFARAVVQAEEFGVSMSTVVRSQAEEMRRGRKLRAETRAQQVPVKILLPLMSCVLPVLFVIVMGPPVVTAFASN